MVPFLWVFSRIEELGTFDSVFSSSVYQLTHPPRGFGCWSWSRAKEEFVWVSSFLGQLIWIVYCLVRIWVKLTVFLTVHQKLSIEKFLTRDVSIDAGGFDCYEVSFMDPLPVYQRAEREEGPCGCAARGRFFLQKIVMG